VDGVHIREDLFMGGAFDTIRAEVGMFRRRLKNLVVLKHKNEKERIRKGRGATCVIVV
jgi:hypothetical protein